MTDDEKVVFAFGGIRVARNIVKMLFIKETVLSACEHLVAVCLVRYIEYYFVYRRIEYIVQSDRCLSKTEIGTAVASVTAELEYKCVTHFLRQLFHFVNAQLLYIRR